MISDLSTYSPFSGYIGSFLPSGIPAWAVIFFSIAVYWFAILMPQVILIRYFDRKLGADVQMRIGPNRVSRFGILQFLADGIKSFFKEEIRAQSQEAWLHRWGPVIAVGVVFLAIGSIPISSQWALSDVESGLIFVVFALMLSQLWLFWSGYGVNSAWSVLSSYRFLALSTLYLIPILLALLPPILISGSANFNLILREQGGWPWQWILFHNPGTLLCFLVLFCSMQIWQARTPLDFTTAPGEIAGGLLAEYSGVRKSLLIFLEYASLFLGSALIVAVFLGGGRLPFDLSDYGRAVNVVEWIVFTLKVFVLVLFSIWVRWSLPRLRIDQIVTFSWRVLVPVGFAGTLITAVWMAMSGGFGLGDLL